MSSLNQYVKFNSDILVALFWQDLYALAIGRNIPLQYVEDTNQYTVFFTDTSVTYYCVLYKSVISASVPYDPSYSQSQNDADRIDFVNSHLQYANQLVDPSLIDTRNIHRLGNFTATSSAESLVSNQFYTEPASQAQRSVVSTNANDSNPSGTGAKQIRLTFLDSNYVQYTEDILLSGTLPINTVSTNIRFVQNMQVIKGAASVGNIKLMTTTSGSGSQIAAIGAATTDAFLCHHYIPSGSYAFLAGWGATSDLSASLKLTGQTRISGNLVDSIIDLEKLYGLSPTPGHLNFYRTFTGVMLVSQSYVRVTVAPSNNLSTVVRAYLDIWLTNI